MVGKVKTLDYRLLTRRCVACGYDGILLRGGTASNCPRCDCDLAQRPARSYAEMEGLIGQCLASNEAFDELISKNHEKLINRWMGFVFFTMIGFIALLYLTAAALAV